jgi:hypothetical protein
MMQSGASTTPAAPAAGVVEARLKMNYVPMKLKDGRGKTRRFARHFDSFRLPAFARSPNLKLLEYRFLLPGIVCQSRTHQAAI